MQHALRLRRGELVEVRSAETIFATLDASGRLDGLPFMPEMLPFCGQRLRVASRADKTCDTIERYVSRRMFDTVHLEAARCDGSGHGDCQAGCLLYWKEAWLVRAESEEKRQVPAPGDFGEAELKASVVATEASRGPELRYRCQATEVLRASEPLPWWAPGQYLRELRSRNLRLGDLLRGGAFALLRNSLAYGPGWRARVWLYRSLQPRLGGPPASFEDGSLKRTPRETLDLRPGDRVRVKSAEQIRATLDTHNRNRGLQFDDEMLAYCETVQTVARRVERIVDDRTGRMLEITNDCIALENVVCPGRCSKNRLFCPRGLVPYWREIWLEKLP